MTTTACIFCCETSKPRNQPFCTCCHEGWISALEATVAPWLEQVKGPEDVQQLQDEARRLTFARWAVMKACRLDAKGRGREIDPDIPGQLFQQQQGVPANLYVLAGFYDGPDSPCFTFDRRNLWTEYPLGVRCESPDCSSEGKFKLAFVTHRLMVLVAGIPSPHLELVIGQGLHVPVWPETTVWLQQWFYPPRPAGAGADEALRKFLDLVALAHGGRLV